MGKASMVDVEECGCCGCEMDSKGVWVELGIWVWVYGQ